MSYTIGGGGGPAGATTVDVYALDKPYDLYWPFTEDQVQQINEMLDMLFKAQTRARADLALIQTASLFSRVVKPRDETRDYSGNTVAESDLYLRFPVESGAKYTIRGAVHWDDLSNTAGAGLAFRMTGPASPTLVSIYREAFSAAASLGIDTVEAFDAADVTAFTGGGLTEHTLVFHGVIHIGAAAGEFRFDWQGQLGVGSNDVTLRAGSYIEYLKVN